MRALRKLRDFKGDVTGVSALEFAILFPVLMILMVAGIQLVAYVNAVRKVELVASSISEMISQASPPNGSTLATVNTQDVHFSRDSAMVIFPYLMKDAARQGISWSQDITIDWASVLFTPVSGQTCSGYDQSKCYTANVVWTSAGAPGTNSRACSTPQLPSTSNTPNKTSIPSIAFGAGSIIVIDVVFTFTPTFGSHFFAAQQIARSVYIQPRYATLINFDTSNGDGTVTKCPGY